MLKTKNYQFWFCTGSQDLYGDECLAHVAEHSKIIVDASCCAGVTPESHKNALEAMKMCQIEIINE